MTENNEQSQSEPETVPELRGMEEGRWEVRTRNSVHLFDLGAQTVTRIPGPNSGPTINDFPREIRSIESCSVGRGGYWTMEPGGYREHVDFFWHMSTPIVSITRIPDENAKNDE